MNITYEIGYRYIKKKIFKPNTYGHDYNNKFYNF